jgi:hypothetical protein
MGSERKWLVKSGLLVGLISLTFLNSGCGTSPAAITPSETVSTARPAEPPIEPLAREVVTQANFAKKRDDQTRALISGLVTGLAGNPNAVNLLARVSRQVGYQCQNENEPCRFEVLESK